MTPQTALPSAADLWLPGHGAFPDLNNPFDLPDDADFGSAAHGGDDLGGGTLIAERIPPARKFKASVFMCIGRRGAGKALSLRTLLPTPRGWTSMGEVQVGDYVFDQQWLPTKVIFKSPVWLGHKVYRVHFDDGSHIDADGEHLWQTSTPDEEYQDEHGAFLPLHRLRSTAVLTGGLRYTSRVRTTDAILDDMSAERRQHSIKAADGSRFYITAIEEIPTVPVQCIGVDSPSHLYLAGPSMIPTHNSLAMTNFLMTQKERFKRAHSNRLIITNYNHHDADVVDPLLVDHLGQFQGSLKDADIGIDEIQGAASSRRSLSMANINMGIFLTQIRKRDMSLWCTCQFPQMMDFWLLMQVDLFLRCEMMPSGKMWIRVHDYWGLYTGNDMRKPWPPRPDQYDWDFTIENPERAYGHYDTNEVVAAVWSKNRAEVLRAQGYDLEKMAKADDDRRRKEQYGEEDEDGFVGTPSPPKDIPTGLPNNEQLYRQHVTSINLLDTMSAESHDEGWVKLGDAHRRVWKLMGLNKGKPGITELGNILSGIGWDVDDTGRPETDWKVRKR